MRVWLCSFALWQCCAGGNSSGRAQRSAESLQLLRIMRPGANAVRRCGLQRLLARTHHPRGALSGHWVTQIQHEMSAGVVHDGR